MAVLCPFATVFSEDRNPAYSNVIRNLKSLDPDGVLWIIEQLKYLNNRIEADHGAIERRIRCMRGFKAMKTAYATLKETSK